MHTAQHLCGFNIVLGAWQIQLAFWNFVGCSSPLNISDPELIESTDAKPLDMQGCVL